ncbi:MAG: hypothetical protein K8R02_02330 [Anaerohalosphaeraceae bacterium]|nr:hypothetical protein [Anaerohalosphaeraceae bacterium]
MFFWETFFFDAINPSLFQKGDCCISNHSNTVLREPLKIHFGGQANLFATGLRQTKAALSTDKADLFSLPDNKNFLLVAQKQLLELPLMFTERATGRVENSY